MAAGDAFKRRDPLAEKAYFLAGAVHRGISQRRQGAILGQFTV
jgi:hypothetical protein